MERLTRTLRLKKTEAAAGRTTGEVIGTPIDAVGWEEAIARIERWATLRESRYVCICDVHSVVTASRDISFQKVLKEADMVTPDGAPVAWMLRRMGFVGQPRINGPDLMWRHCAAASASGTPIFLYGSYPETLDALQQELSRAFAGLKLVGSYSPPFRALREDEEAEVLRAINESGAAVVWVSLGCPKQERWMAEYRGRIQAVMIGVGAAFDYHAGTIKRAPQWMQNAGLEWLQRLCAEPRRLWKRYLFNNTVFVFKAAIQLLRR